ncbi:MAG: GNAT family N-acetyltransferase [Acidimicrobiales bacterium]
MDGEVRDYRDDDLPSVTRMWREIGWIDDSELQAEALSHLMSYGATRVGVIDGDAECLVHRTPGTIRYDRQDLPLCAITAVTTSSVARNLGLATHLTAEAIAAGAVEGAAVAALGMFEQGFYNRFGMGTLAYLHHLTFDPAKLRVGPPRRRPVRITRDDWAEVAGLMGRRARRHAAVTLDPPEVFRAELAWTENPFVGLGFRADDGRLTACIIGTNAGEHGPFKVGVLGYEDDDDLRDLLGLLRTLAAQVHEVSMVEPAGIQLQDLLDTPIRGSGPDDPTHRTWHTAMAWYQLRLLDLGVCVAARTWPGDDLAFDLVLTDPLSEADVAWPGLAGDHSITIGRRSCAQAGHRGDLPTLRASVSAFSRLWFGVRPATGLAITDELAGPPELLRALDDALLLPPPLPELSF